MDVYSAHILDLESQLGQLECVQRSHNTNMNKQDQYHHGNLRQTLLTEAIREIRAQGVDNLSLRALARHAGVSQTAPYRHFADKEALLAEIAALAFVELAQATLKPLQEAEQAIDKVKLATAAYLSYATENPEKYRLMFGPSIKNREAHPHLVESGEAAFALLRQFIEEGQRSGAFMAGDSQQMAGSIWAGLHGYALMHIDGLYPRLDLPENPEDMLNLHVRMLLRSLSA